MVPRIPVSPPRGGENHVKRFLSSLSLAILMIVTPSFAQTQPPLIPRDVLFGNPERAQLRISPGGKHLSFLAPENGVLNVGVAPTNDLSAAKAITPDLSGGLIKY